MRTILLTIIMLAMALEGHCQSKATYPVTGTVKGGDGTALPGAVVQVKGTGNAVLSDENGHFHLKTDSTKQVLLVTYLGHLPQELEIRPPLGAPLNIDLSGEGPG